MSFKICIIGCGGISKNCHGPSYAKYRRENPCAELSGCCDLDAGRASAYSKEFGFARWYTDYVRMLQIEKPDAVCVTVDEDHTAGVGAEIINMGFPVFIEKPPGKNSAETQSLIRAARQSGVINQVGYNRRAMPILRKLKSMIAETIARETAGAVQIGIADKQNAADASKVADASSKASRHAPDASDAADESDAAAAAAAAAASRDASRDAATARHAPQYIRYDFYRVRRFDDDFSDTAVHGIDAVRYIAGADYKTVRFMYQALPQYGANVKNIYMDCVMTSGMHAQLSFCPVSGVVLERATVNAEDNTWMAHTPIWADGYDRPGELIHIQNGKTEAAISGADLCDSDEVYITNGFYNENKEFFDNVKAGRRCVCDLEASLNTSLVKDCIVNNLESFG